MRSSKRAGGEEVLLGFDEVAFGLLGEHGDHVDGLACAEEVYARFLAFGGGGAELYESVHVKRLNEALEGELGDGPHGGVGGADGGVESVGGGFVGGVGLVALLGGGGRRHVGDVVFAYRAGGCGRRSLGFGGFAGPGSFTGFLMRSVGAEVAFGG